MCQRTSPEGSFSLLQGPALSYQPRTYIVKPPTDSVWPLFLFVSDVEERLCNSSLPLMTTPRTNSMTKDSQTAEMGGVHTGDEAELARMGYKQELK